MRLDLVVAQMRALCPIFAGRVAGSATFEGVADVAELAIPAAYVVPGDSTAEANTSRTGLSQKVFDRFQIIAVFDNQADRRGQTVAEQYPLVQAQIFKALLNWRIDPVRAPRGLEFDGGEVLRVDRGRLFYGWTFLLETRLDALDGFVLDAPPLTEIDLAVSTYSVAAVVTLPQE